MFGWQVKVPFLACGEDGQRNSFMKSIFKELFVRSFTLAHLFHFDKYVRPTRLVAQGEVNSFALNGVLRTNNLRIEDRPS